jgi:hypothetical protein
MYLCVDKDMNLSFMLNFPKIKKSLKDFDKLVQYLREDDRYESRNYEIDFEKGLIRKKHILDPREAHPVYKQP